MAQATADIQTIAPKAESGKPSALRGLLDSLTVPFLAIFTALVLSGLIIAFTDPEVLAALSKIGSNPVGFLGAVWKLVSVSYVALFQGAFGDWGAIARGFQTWTATGNEAALLRALRDPAESLVSATPYIFAGLAVAVGFKAGLFNIGAEGQVFAGGLASAYVGYAFTGLPWFIHLPLALVAGFLAGAIWGGIPGWLKAKTGAHEVINTMMMNYIIFNLSDWLVGPNGPMRAKGGAPRSPEISASAYLPHFLPDPVRIHWGFILALAAVVFVWWFLNKTTLGFEIRTTGSSPSAAKYAGINVSRNFVIAMGLSGGLAGLAGANELLGLNHYFTASFSPGYGFDSIALALLGKSSPVGVLFSALMFGLLRNGATRMQSVAGVPVDIISVTQAMIIAFIAAPAIVRWLFRLRAPKAGEREVFTRGWGG